MIPFSQTEVLWLQDTIREIDAVEDQTPGVRQRCQMMLEALDTALERRRQAVADSLQDEHGGGGGGEADQKPA